MLEGAAFDDRGKNKISDYIGVIYPNGINPDDAFLFNNEDIDQIIFEGYSDEEEERYVKVYSEWKGELEAKERKGNSDMESFGF